MRKFLFLALAVLLCHAFIISASASRIRLQESKLHGLYVFVKAISEMPDEPPSMNTAFKNSTRYYTTENQRIVKEFKKLQPLLEQQVQFSGFPASRYMGRTLGELISIQTMQAASLDDLSNRIAAYIPLADLRVFMRVMRHFQPAYETLIYDVQAPSMLRFQDKLRFAILKNKINSYLPKIATFYDADWTDSIDFTATLYPVPLSDKLTIGLALANFQSISIPRQTPDINGTISVIVHELCHTIYDSQNRDTQKELESLFFKNKAANAKDAYYLLDEALASAIGNAYIMKKMTGTLPTGAWYEEADIDAFAKALYKGVEIYLDQNKKIDADFVERAIQAHAKLKPKKKKDL